MRIFSGTTGALAALLLATVLVGPAAAGDPVPEPAPAPAPAPTVSEVRVFGTTVKGRPLKAFRIGDPTSARKVVLVSTMHGNEAGTSRILTNLIQGSAVTGADIWVIPSLNLDGVARGTRKNARGVDLNRNFPRHWKRQSGPYASGRRPASEPETRALMRFLGRVDPTFVVSLHQPLFGIDTSYPRTRALGRRLVEELQLPPKTFRCNGRCHGTMTQWFNANHRGAALTVEYGARVSTRQARVTGPEGLLSAVFAKRIEGPALSSR